MVVHRDIRRHRLELTVRSQLGGARSSHGHEPRHRDPDDHDRGLQFDLGTLVARRRLFGLFAGAAGATALAACGLSNATRGSVSGSTATTTTTGGSTGSGTLTETPEETAGPYPGDGSNGANVLKESGVVRRDIHYEVYPSLSAATDVANKIGTSQIALPDETCNVVYATSGYEQSLRNMQRVSLSADNVLSDGWTTQLATISGDDAGGFIATVTYVV